MTTRDLPKHCTWHVDRSGKCRCVSKGRLFRLSDRGAGLRRFHVAVSRRARKQIGRVHVSCTSEPKLARGTNGNSIAPRNAADGAA